MAIWKYLGFGRSATLTNRYGRQITDPVEPLVLDAPQVGIDAAMQIATVWRAIEIRAKTIATMPMVVYINKDGLRIEARDDPLWDLLHESPNARQTPAEFWTALLLNYLLRGNGYAEISRNTDGTPYAVTPLSADDVEPIFGKNGDDLFRVRTTDAIREIATENMLHIKEMSGGLVGISRSAYMRASLNEAANTQRAANTLFARGGRTTGILSPAGAINDQQWAKLQERINELLGGEKTIQVLPGDMKFNQINLTPQDLQLLTTRQFTVQEIGRWFGVPAVLLNQTEGTTTLGSSSGEIIENFYKTTVRSDVINIEQALRKRLMSSRQRVRLTAEFNMDALLRASLKDRMEIYAKAVQNGIKNRNECRKLENDAPFDGGELYTAQSNLLPINQLGTQTAQPTITLTN